MNDRGLSDVGLRERKRLATYRAIQLAVLTLVSERGLDRVTIDEIGRRADISPRTFFNYFATKEAALQGVTPTLSSVDTERFLSGADGVDVLDGLERLLIEASQTRDQDLQLVQLRHAVLKRYPQLFATRIVAMREFEDEVAGLVRQRLLLDSPHLTEDEAHLIGRARLLTLVAFAAMRNAWAQWATGDAAANLPDELASSFRELRALFAAEPR